MALEDKTKLTHEEIRLNREIARSGLIVGMCDFLLTFAGCYLSNINKFGFNETNQKIVNEIEKSRDYDFKLHLIYK